MDYASKLSLPAAIANLNQGIAMIDVKRFESLLRNQRKILADIAESSRQAAATVELDQTRVGRLSRMDALQSQALSQEAIRRREIELANISSALARIEAGEYGYCEECGEEIAFGRLEIDPAGPLCVSCATALERR